MHHHVHILLRFLPTYDTLFGQCQSNLHFKYTRCTFLSAEKSTLNTVHTYTALFVKRKISKSIKNSLAFVFASITFATWITSYIAFLFIVSVWLAYISPSLSKQCTPVYTVHKVGALHIFQTFSCYVPKL